MKSDLGTRLRTDINNGLLESFTSLLEAICSDKKLAKKIFSETSGKAKNNALEDAWEKAIDEDATPDNKTIFLVLLEKYEELMPNLLEEKYMISELRIRFRMDIDNGLLDSFIPHLEDICADEKSAKKIFSETSGKAKNNALEDAWEKAIDEDATPDNKKIFLMLLEKHEELMTNLLKKMCKKFGIEDLEKEREKLEKECIAHEDEEKKAEAYYSSDELSISEYGEKAEHYAAGDFSEAEIFSPSSAGEPNWLQRIGVKPSTLVTSWVDSISTELTLSKDSAKHR